MWSVKGPRSTAARLAAFYAVLFSLSVIALGTISVVLVDAALRRQIDTRISAEMNDLLAISSNGSALADVIKSRIGNEIGLKYRLETTTGALLAGNLAPTGSASGWFNFGVSENGQEEAADSFRGYAKTVGAVYSPSPKIPTKSKTSEISWAAYLPWRHSALQCLRSLAVFGLATSTREGSINWPIPLKQSPAARPHSACPSRGLVMNSTGFPHL